VISSGGNLTWSNTFPRTVASWTQSMNYSGNGKIIVLGRGTLFILQ
jgi:hypothetical protein